MIYSHGFEEIYALEKVDVRSIRTIPAEGKKLKRKSPSPSQCKPQMQLDFGEPFRLVLPSFILTEPIQRIGLSRNLEAWLISRSIFTIEALIKAPLDELPDTHHQEITDKVEEYVSGRPLYDTDRVDYLAWVRGLLGASQPLRSYSFLEQWGLEEAIELLSQERVEMRRLTEDRKQKLSGELLQELQGKREFFSKALCQVNEVLIRPWIRARGGLATRLELSEFLVAIGEEPEAAQAAIAFLSRVFCEETFILTHYLYHADEKLYCSDEAVADAYDAVIDKAHSYFYNDCVLYQLDHLEELLNREMAHEWRGYPDGFVRKAMRLSPQFTVRRGEKALLQVAKA